MIREKHITALGLTNPEDDEHDNNDVTAPNDTNQKRDDDVRTPKKTNRKENRDIRNTMETNETDDVRDSKIIKNAKDHKPADDVISDRVSNQKDELEEGYDPEAEARAFFFLTEAEPPQTQVKCLL